MAYLKNNPNSNQTYNTDRKCTKSMRHNTAYRQKNERNTYTGNNNGQNIYDFFYHAIFKSFFNSPYRQQQNN